MADPKIRIPIELPAGDMSGVETAKREIEDVKAAAASVPGSAEDPALEKQRIEDVAEARRRASNRRVEDLERERAAEIEAGKAAQDSARLRLAAGAALAASARAISQQTVEVLNQYKELGVQLGGFESIGLEFADFLTRPFEFVTDAFTDYKEDLKLLKESQLEVIRQEELYQAALRRRNEQLAAASRERISNFLAAEQRAIDEQTAAYERQLRVIQAVALANGKTPTAGDAADQRIAAAERKLEDAERLFDAATSALADTSRLTAEEARKLSDDAQAAQDAVGNAAAELETVRIEGAAAKVELGRQSAAEIQGLVASNAAANTKAAQEAKSALEAEAAEQGKDLTSGGKESLRILTEALKDGVVSPEEMAAITQAINQVKYSRDAADAEIKRSFETLEKTNQAALAALRELHAQNERTRSQMEGMQALINAGGN